jgi:predicted permease
MAVHLRQMKVMPNIRVAFRTLFKTPFITIIAILSLGLGIGANAAIFSLFDQILLRPLPVPAPDELVNLANPGPKPGSQSCGQEGSCEQVFSYAMFRDLEKQQQVFTGIAAHNGFSANITYKGETVNASGVLVSGSYFSVLGLQPAAGRLIGYDDDRTPQGHPVVVLSHSYWRTRFAESPQVVGEQLIVNGQPLTILGVAPRGFDGATLGSKPFVFVPLTMRANMVPNSEKVYENRRSYWAYLFARLNPGISIEQASASINTVYRAIVNDVEAPLQRGMSEQTMQRFRTKQLTLAPGARGQSSLHGEARVPLLVLLSVTGVVLLIACANIANLLLARAANRAGEMAVRLSVGASRARLIGQLLTESLLLAIMGGTAGILVSRWTLDLLASVLPPEASDGLSFAIDLRMLAFALALSITTGVLFGLFPALHSTKPDLATTLKGESGRGAGSRSASRFRLALATSQIALSMTLLICAGLFTKSLMNVSRIDLGIRTEKLVTFGVSPVLNGYAPQQSRAFFERVEDSLAATPGVTSAAASMVPLVSGNSWGNSLTVQGFQSGPDTDTHSRFNVIGPGFFHTVGMPLLAGRDFTRADALGRQKVAIVNEAFVKKFNLGREAIGKYMGDGVGNETKLDTLIVGVAKDAKYAGVKDPVPPTYWTPYRQDEHIGFIRFYVRTTLNEDELMRTIPAVIKRLDASLPVEDLRTMDMQVKENLFLDRMISTLSAGFAVLATLLAAVGLYGVLAYTITQRTKEFGVRMALGADASRVRGMVLGQVGRMTLVGAIIGVAAAYGLGRVAASLLYEMEGHDPFVFGLSVVMLGLVALGAGFLPAHRASRLDPVRALRYE